MVDSKSKGKRGELEAAHAITETFGCIGRRGVQFKGTPDSPDVVTDIEGVHFEVKRTERLRLYDALDQAVAEAGCSIPVVLHRQNRRPWVLCVRLADVPKLVSILSSWKEGSHCECVGRT